MRPRTRLLLCAVMLTMGAWPLAAQGLGPEQGDIWVPDTTQEQWADVGHRAHTNHLILMQRGRTPSGPTGLVPSEVRAAYGLPAYTLGQSAGSQVIAVVDANDYPTAVADFNAFSQTFGLPQETGSGNVLQVVYATGNRPSANAGWSQEAAIDIEWAHAMAPAAKIVLVEAASSNFSDLLYAVQVAGTISGVRESP